MSRLPKPPVEDMADLFGDRPTRRERTFLEFDRDNPDIWRRFVALAEDRIGRGFQRYSARDIMAYLRWHSETTGDDGFKINNNYSSFYARKWRHLDLHPELPDFFEFRKAPRAAKEMPSWDRPGVQQQAGSMP